MKTELGKPYIPNGMIAETFGYEDSHRAVDYYMPFGSNVLAVQLGVVKKVEKNDELGLHIVIEHQSDPDEYLTTYAYMLRVTAKPGQIVNMGDVIGLSGGTEANKNVNMTTDPHLHFSMQVVRNNVLVDIDPRPYFTKKEPVKSGYAKIITTCSEEFMAEAGNYETIFGEIYPGAVFEVDPKTSVTVNGNQYIYAALECYIRVKKDGKDILQIG